MHTVIRSIALAIVAAPLLLAQNLQNDPFEAMLQLQREMDAAMARFHEQMMRQNGFGDFMQMQSTLPPVDLKENDGKYILSMEIPGADEKSINIKTQNNFITVSAKREEVQDENDTNYYRHERRVSSFARSLSLPYDADLDHMKTAYKNGILTITMPKKKHQ
jgi:HSP20 family molecular chaperone IbpA